MDLQDQAGTGTLHAAQLYARPRQAVAEATRGEVWSGWRRKREPVRVEPGDGSALRPRRSWDGTAGFYVDDRQELVSGQPTAFPVPDALTCAFANDGAPDCHDLVRIFIVPLGQTLLGLPVSGTDTHVAVERDWVQIVASGLAGLSGDRLTLALTSPGAVSRSPGLACVGHCPGTC